jgi:two-component system, sensor histidine kinase and response regulator
VRLLIIDDDKIDQKTVLNVVEPISEGADVADTGEQGKALLEKNIYDCVIMDNMLPDMSGSELSQELLKIRDCCIVAITGQGDEMIAAELMKAGCSDYVPKNKIEEKLISSITDSINSFKKKEFDIKKLKKISQQARARIAQFDKEAG